MNNPEASLVKMDSAFEIAVKRMAEFNELLIKKYGYHFPHYRGWKKLSSRRGTPWYRHRDAWAKSYWHDFGSMRLAMLARYWISTMRDCEEIAKKYAARNVECAT